MIVAIATAGLALAYLFGFAIMKAAADADERMEQIMKEMKDEKR